MHLFLKNKFNINSDLTIGNVYLEDKGKIKKYNFEELSNMTKRLKTHNDDGFGGHVWLTIGGCYIADLKLLPSIWHERFIKNKDKEKLLKEEQEESLYKNVIFSSLEQLENSHYKYEPIIIGEDYLRKSKLLTK